MNNMRVNWVTNLLLFGILLALSRVFVFPPAMSQNQNATEQLLTAINTGVSSPIPPCATTPCVTTIGNSGSIVNTNNVDTKLHACGSTVTKHITTAADTQLVASVNNQTVYVCDYEFSFNGTGQAFLEQSTAGTCGTPSQIGQIWYGVANTNKFAGNVAFRGLKTPVSAQLCVNTSAAVGFDITVYYDQY